MFLPKRGLAIGVAYFLAAGYLSGAAAIAGPQSLLDPYADIQPTSSPVVSNKSVAVKKVPKLKPTKGQQVANQGVTNELGSRTSSRNPNSSAQHLGKVAGNKAISQVSAPAGNATNNPTVLSGLKEIQHGYVTSFKAAGQGIVNSSKAAGAKIAAGTRTIAGGAKTLGGKFKDGIGAAGSKIASVPKALAMKAPQPKPKDNNQSQMAIGAQMAAANRGQLAARQPMPILPGKPLAPVSKTLPHARVAKAPGVKNQNIVARTFNKLNIFAKNKNANQPRINVAANNPNGNGISQ